MGNTPAVRGSLVYVSSGVSGYGGGTRSRDQRPHQTGGVTQLLEHVVCLLLASPELTPGLCLAPYILGNGQGLASCQG